jgi:DNA-binding transcriptional LysR family regulator
MRLYVTHLAGAAVIAPVWARFLSSFPDVQLEVHTAEAPADIVAKGFDAGIAPKDWAADMIAVRVTGPMRVAVVGAPTYFARRRSPRVPDDLARHSCVQYRRAAGGAMFEWPLLRCEILSLGRPAPMHIQGYPRESALVRYWHQA